MRDDDISLARLLHVVLSHSKVVVLCVTACFCIGIAVTTMSPQRWTASTEIIIIPPKVQSIFSANDSFVVAQNERLSISVESHRLLLNSSLVLKRVIDRLNLTSKGVPISPEELSGALKVKSPQGATPVSPRGIAQTSILTLKVRWREPQQAIAIANAWAEEYIQYTKELIASEIHGAGGFIATQFDKARQRLDDAEKQQLEYIAATQPDLLRSELELKKQKLVEFTQELLTLNIAIQTQQDTLAELQKQIGMQEKYVVLAKAITDDALWQLEGKGGGIPSSVADRRLRSEEKNPVYFDLAKRIADAQVELSSLRARFNYVSEASSRTLREIEQLSRELSRVQLRVAQLNRAVAVASDAYNTLSRKVADANLVNLLTFSEVRLVSPAVQSRKSMFNTVIVLFSLMLGILVGVFGAFAVQFVEDNANLFAKEHRDPKVDN